jgi:pimeloyl-ACP methyl ester carboxylesterase
MNSILLLHGALGSKTQLDPLKSLLETKGRTVYLMNFSGHSGEPFATTFGIEAFADDVLKFLKSNSLDKVDVFGYSMGGYVAVWFAHLHSERVGKIVTLGTKFDWNIASAEKETKKLNAEKIEEKVPAFARILLNRHAPNNWKELLAKTSDLMNGLGGKPLLKEEIFRSVKNEIHILLGDQDDMADKKFSIEVSKALPNATFDLLKDTPHPIEKVNLSNIVSLF